MPERASIEEVKKFWEENPLCASAIPHPLGSREYFSFYDGLREQNETLEFSYRLHEYERFRGKRVLDVGCGNGYVLGKYAREGAAVYGVDITETGIGLCRKRFEFAGAAGSFQVASAEALPFEDGSFDCVTSMGVLHHTPDTERAFREVHRVLKPGGLFIVMLYHRNSAWYQIGMRFKRLRSGMSMTSQVNAVDGDGNPKGAVYTRQDLVDLLGGYRDVEMFSGLLNSWMVFPRGARFVNDRWLKPFERRFGWFLYGKATKV